MVRKSDNDIDSRIRQVRVPTLVEYGGNFSGGADVTDAQGIHPDFLVSGSPKSSPCKIDADSFDFIDRK